MELFDSLSLVLFFQHIFGVSPFKRLLSENQNGERKYFKTSILITMQSHFPFYITIFQLIFTFFYVFTNTKRLVQQTVILDDRGEMVQVISMVVISITTFYYVVCLATAFWNRSNQIKLLLLFNSIDKRLIRCPLLNINMNYKHYYQRAKIELFTIFFYFFVVQTFCFYFVFKENSTSFFINILYVLTNLLQSVSTIMNCYSFTNYVKLIRLRAEMLITKLTTTIKTCNSSDEKHLNDLLKVIFKTYKNLLQSIHIINDIFGLTNLIGITQDFTVVTAQCFLVFYILRDDQQRTEKFGYVIAMLSWMTPSILKIIIISINCEATIQKV